MRVRDCEVGDGVGRFVEHGHEMLVHTAQVELRLLASLDNAARLRRVRAAGHAAVRPLVPGSHPGGKLYLGLNCWRCGNSCVGYDFLDSCDFGVGIRRCANSGI